MAGVISSFEKFAEQFPATATDKDSARIAALKSYFARGGVISIGKSENAWPRLVYPSPLRVKQQMAAINSVRGNYLGKKKDWERQSQQAKTYEIRCNLLKFSSPLYWKHTAKCLIDADYRSDTDQVKLPVHLVNDKRWEPMVREFVSDIEYRKQLVETVQNSIVYSKGRKVARYAKELQAFRIDISDKKIAEIGKKISELDAQIKTLQAILVWARE